MLQTEIDELEVQKNINSCIDSFKSFRFNAGAGAGKTYALIQTIRYILRNKLIDLRRKNQQVICITYTNVAVREIKERLGSSEVVLISTIHDRLWSIIKPYQKELIEIHDQKLRKEIELISNELSDKDNPKLAKYASLSEQERIDLHSFLFKHRENYFLNRDKSAAEFRKSYESIPNKPMCFNDLIKSAGNFKEVAKRIYRKSRYDQCIQDIENNKKTKVDYDSAFNADRLEYMKFSHDTLLEYSQTLFDKYPMLCRLVIDKYPYFFVDEYQDSNEKVINIIKQLFTASVEIKKSWLVGYFGDTAQNIYDDGVGRKITKMHSQVLEINKIYNRRSHKKIIDIANMIRNDEIRQKPIFDERNDGTVEFYYCATSINQEEIALSFLNKYRSDLLSDEKTLKKQIDCLVLTNKLMATLSGFGDIQSNVSNAKSIYWNEINTKLLSHDLEKLHPTIHLLYKVIKLQISLTEKNSTYKDIFGTIKGGISFSRALQISEALKNIKANTLNDFIFELSKILTNSTFDATALENILQNLSVKLKDFKEEQDFYSYLKSEISVLMLGSENTSLDDADPEETKSLLNITLDQWHRWVNFIDRNEKDKEIIYHTYHGTKGEEYENVAIIMEHSFGGGHEGRDKFKNYFLKLEEIKRVMESEGKAVKTDDEFENTKNLIYVAYTRAIKNLKILYIDDIQEIQGGIKAAFGIDALILDV
ncbi:UvrD-helicase domain-containing protein [Cellvibrio japonicus]|uniref:DNA 3'-5' helicase II n=1 Tax=Cellvibrio japonicus (strain Ueda107) TaxID=498211 RepID=B3PHY6_CELJU|nr:UvrD-helicase domain-containing protein [Cellvibrio japonicus]ACE85975.1 UvrD/REP helicase [Cellvibrio japonicus Ueda107]QEI13923.1 ATP-dependent helicase [Cellvibrio japonicus]QEI17497.1 ATP-dependent helicase [Cellvibrio japonicus]QEI21073.1 ATP-dependent helicase [Cellvibrio japonicus]